MWLHATKTIGYFLSPLPFTVLLIVLAILFGLLQSRKLATTFWVFGVSLLLITSSPLVEREMKQYLEAKYPPVALSETPIARLIVVLGGAIMMPSPPRLQVELADSSDRVLHAFRLYKAGRAPTIFLSAGNLDEVEFEQSEAYYIASLLKEWGVPDSAIVPSGNSRSTWENALEVLDYLEENRLTDSPILLVTSAIHMPRAMQVFQSMGINAIPSTTDISLVSSEGSPGIANYLPSVGALKGVSSAWHELLGTWYYQMRGWI